MPPVVTLTDETHFSSGERRECHVHPDDASICIKLPTKKKGVEDSRREIAYMRAIQNRRHFDAYSRFLYPVETNKGLGHAFELIRDSTTGDISQPLDKVYLDALFYARGPDVEELDREVASLLTNLLANKVLVADFKASNVVVQYTGTEQFSLKIIDGLGRNKPVPFLDRLGIVSRTKIKHYFRRQCGVTLKSYREACAHVRQHG